MLVTAQVILEITYDPKLVDEFMAHNQDCYPDQVVNAIRRLPNKQVKFMAMSRVDK